MQSPQTYSWLMVCGSGPHTTPMQAKIPTCILWITYHLRFTSTCQINHSWRLRNHSGDLAYVFGTIDKVGYDWTDMDRMVSAQMMAYWTHFARTGSPNVPGQFDWPAYTRVINSAPTTVNGVRNTIMSIFASAE